MAQRKPKTQAQLLSEVAAALDKARNVEQPHLRYRFLWTPPTTDTPKGQRLLNALKELRLAYQDFYGLKKVNIEVDLT